MSTDRVVFGCGGLESLSSYSAIQDLVQLAVDLEIINFDTAPTYYWGYAEKFLFNFRSQVNITSKLPLNIMPNTWVPKEIFPLFYRIVNRKYIRKILDTIYTVRIYDSKSILPMEQSLSKSLRSCGVNSLSCYLLHGISSTLWTQELIQFLKSSKSNKLTSKIGISLEGHESISELEEIILNNNWIDTIQIRVSSDAYSMEDLILLTHKYTGIEFVVRGFFSTFGVSKAQYAIKDFLSRSYSTSRIIYSTSSEFHLEEFVQFLKNI